MVTFEIFPAWKCTDCGFIQAEEPVAKVRECSYENCGTTFVSEERACPNCNRPFSRILGDHGCESCEQGNMEEVEVIGRCAHCNTVLEADELDQDI